MADTTTPTTPTLEAFSQSAPLTLGVELELQLVNTNDYDLAPYAAEMLHLIARHKLPGSVWRAIRCSISAA